MPPWFLAVVGPVGIMALGLLVPFLLWFAVWKWGTFENADEREGWAISGLMSGIVSVFLLLSAIVSAIA